MITLASSKQVITHWEEYDDDTKFQLRPLSNAHVIELESYLEFKDDADGVRRGKLTARGIELVVNYGLRDWSGVVDEDGQPVAFTKELALTMDRLALKFVAYTLFTDAYLTVEDKKKLSSQQTQPGSRKSTTAKRAKKGTVRKKRKLVSKST